METKLQEETENELQIDKQGSGRMSETERTDRIKKAREQGMSV